MLVKSGIIEKETVLERNGHISADLFREAMSQLGAPVVLVTTNGAHGRHGLTVSAICSVSADPPMVLVCINRNSRSHEAFIHNGVIGISILEPRHETLASRFASGKLEQDEKFSGHDWLEQPDAAPVLKDAAVTLRGYIAQRHSSGSHDILLCSVQDITLSDKRASGLIWFDRGFHHLASPVA